MNRESAALVSEIERMSPTERGQWLQGQAQQMLVADQAENMVWINENLSTGKSSQVEYSVGEEVMRNINKSANVVYKKRGLWERLEGHAEGWGDVRVERQLGASDTCAEWDIFYYIAKRRQEYVWQIAEVVGFDLLGHGISEKPEEPYEGDYEAPVRKISAKKPYQVRAAELMKEKNIETGYANIAAQDYKGAQEVALKNLVIEKTLGMGYVGHLNSAELRGEIDNQPLWLLHENMVLGEERFEGNSGALNLTEGEAQKLWKKYMPTVFERESIALSLYENEEHILRELGVV